MPDVEDTTTVVVPEDKDATVVTDKEDKDKSTEVIPEAGTDPKDKTDEEEDPVVEDTTKEDDDSSSKDQNRLGYQLRQIRAGDPFVAQAKKALTDDYVNAEGLTEDQREIRQMKADNYIEKLERQRATLVSDNQKVAEEFAFFRPLNPDGTKNPEFNESLYKRAVDRFGRDSLQMSEPDAQGKSEIVGYKVRFLDYMREEADLYLAGRSQSKDKTPAPKDPAKVETVKDDTKDKATMDAASEEPGGASTTKADESEENTLVKAFLAGFDSV